MITVVVCSVNPDLLLQLQNSLATTIGVEYELLVWDNRKEQRGLCEMYNSMAARARFPLLCFLHEDILLQTLSWGKVLVNLFESNPDTGVIGIAGGKYKSAAYSGWFTGNPELDCYNITHRIQGKDHKLVQQPGGTARLQEVICVDGVFMACRKSLWERVKFGDQLLKGFHFYDIDFSLRSSLECKVMVTLDIDIIHITSGGDYGNNWVKEAIIFHEKQHCPLPRKTNEVAMGNHELEIVGTWLDFLKKEKISLKNKWLWIKKQQLYLHPGLWYDISKFILYRPLGLQTIHRLWRGHAAGD